MATRPRVAYFYDSESEWLACLLAERICLRRASPRYPRARTATAPPPPTRAARPVHPARLSRAVGNHHYGQGHPMKVRFTRCRHRRSRSILASAPGADRGAAAARAHSLPAAAAATRPPPPPRAAAPRAHDAQPDRQLRPLPRDGRLVRALLLLFPPPPARPRRAFHAARCHLTAAAAAARCLPATPATAAPRPPPLALARPAARRWSTTPS